MAKKTPKTNAMRQLDTAGIQYKTIAYVCDGKNFDGEKVAELTGLPGEQVFKTLVTRDEQGQIVVCCIPVNQRINLKVLAAAADRKRLEMIKPTELLGLTGYIRGGCSPIGMKKPYPVFIDESVILFEQIAVSAGIRGLQILLAPEDLIRQCNAQTGEFCQI